VQGEFNKSESLCGEEREANYRASTTWLVFHRVRWRFFVSTSVQYQDTAGAMRKA
jgi:hypothetical protein